MRRSVARFLPGAMVLLACGWGGPVSAAIPDIAGVWSPIWDRDLAQVPAKLLPPAPPDPPFRPEYQAKADALQKEIAALQATNRVDPASLTGKLETSCLPYGMPAMMAATYSLEILQAPGQVTVLGEAMREVRRIYLNRPQLPLDDVAPGYWGRSVGRWKGATLEVDTIGIKPEVIGFGLFHSPLLRITERIRLVTPELLRNQITVMDPIALERPYTYTVLLMRLHDYETPEWVCDDIRETIDAKGEVSLKPQQ